MLKISFVLLICICQFNLHALKHIEPKRVKDTCFLSDSVFLTWIEKIFGEVPGGLITHQTFAEKRSKCISFLYPFSDEYISQLRQFIAIKF